MCGEIGEAGNSCGELVRVSGCVSVLCASALLGATAAADEEPFHVHLGLFWYLPSGPLTTHMPRRNVPLKIPRYPQKIRNFYQILVKLWWFYGIYRGGGCSPQIRTEWGCPAGRRRRVPRRGRGGEPQECVDSHGLTHGPFLL